MVMQGIASCARVLTLLHAGDVVDLFVACCRGYATAPVFLQAMGRDDASQFITTPDKNGRLGVAAL
jgi:hypothetical protein